MPNKKSQTVIELAQVRNELWKKSLKKANGNINIAADIYEKLCDFP